jgi:hypothetical protein
MRPNINEIVVDELEFELNDIISYRKAVASGIEVVYDSVLDDDELTNAMQKVIDHYKSKLFNVSYDSDDAFYNNIQDGFDFKWTPRGEYD